MIQLPTIIIATLLTVGGMPGMHEQTEREHNYHDTCKHEPCEPSEKHKPTPPPQSPPAPVPQPPSVPTPAPTSAPVEQPAPQPVVRPEPVPAPVEEYSASVESWGK